MQHILLIDNYDSFTFNLYHYLVGLGAKVDVVRNDEVRIKDIDRYDKIVLSPGPGLPEEAGKLMDVIRAADTKITVLGICLGMQAMALHLGGTLENKKAVSHGVADRIRHNGQNPLFTAVPEEFDVGLYHSWRITGEGDYSVDAYALKDNTVMAMSNQQRKMYAVQFHPESVMTQEGRKIIASFLKIK